MLKGTGLISPGSFVMSVCYRDIEGFVKYFMGITKALAHLPVGAGSLHDRMVWVGRV